MIRDLFAVLGPEHRRPMQRLLVVLTAAAVLQGVAFALLVPLFERLLGDDPSAAWPWLGGFVAASAVWAVVAWRAQNAAFRTGADLALVLHRRLGDAVVRLPLGWFGPRRQGELSRLASQGVLQLMNVPAHLLRPAVTAAVVPATVVVGMALFDVRLAVALALAAPALALLLRWSNRTVQRADRARDSIIDESAARIVEFAQLQPVLRAFGRHREGSRDLDAALVAERDADRALMWQVVPGLVTFAVAVRTVVLTVLALGVYLVLGGDLAPATLLAVLVLSIRFVEPLASAAELGAGLRMAATNLAAVRRILDAPTLPPPSEPAVPDGNVVEFANVHFGYDGRPVLRGVSFTLPERSLTALVGPSGAGKSTIAKLLARFWDVDAGEIRLGEVPVDRIAPDELMSRIAFVFQDVYLFAGTLAENIRLGRDDATDEEVRAAAALAGLDDVIAELPDGLDTPVGEAGAALSGGQRQRVSIARAILKDAPIVVLDEATSALDPENDAAVRAGVAVLAQRSTLLVIAHRLQTVRDADQILVVSDGRITERGGHDELVNAGGTYATFWQERLASRGWHLTSAL